MRIKHALSMAAASCALITTGALAQSMMVKTTVEFKDLSPNHWAALAATWASRTELMTGPGDAPGTFDPDGQVNRAQLAMVLARMEENMLEKLEKRLETIEAKLNIKVDEELELEDFDEDEEDDEEEEDNEGESEDDDEDTSLEVNLRLTADLEGDAEVPAVNTEAEGDGRFTLNGDDLTYMITVQGMTGSITAAHFHKAVTGVNGPVVQAITFEGMRAQGTWTSLTEEEKQDLKNGKMYVNIHTAKHPNGEIRGQVLLAD